MMKIVLDILTIIALALLGYYCYHSGYIKGFEDGVRSELGEVIDGPIVMEHTHGGEEDVDESKGQGPCVFYADNKPIFMEYTHGGEDNG